VLAAAPATCPQRRVNVQHSLGVSDFVLNSYCYFMCSVYIYLAKLITVE